MSKWTHVICPKCWNEKNPDKPTINTVVANSEENCCWCGGKAQTESGVIYLRADPAETKCGGAHAS